MSLPEINGGDLLLETILGGDFPTCESCGSEYPNYKFFETPVHAASVIGKIILEFPEGIISERDCPLYEDFYFQLLDLARKDEIEGFWAEGGLLCFLRKHHKAIVEEKILWTRN
jgi:hypothetical protein